ncbi:hypothetical protein ACFQY7_48420 [Actinomadura luteofluorescens]|uniref:hypothetical protein n=1 Tax=Actinomadura luteofluorescens TaxID=46163 RepID=UPI003637865C
MLYPFLYAGGSGLDTLLEDVRRSTREKADEIVRLREAVLERYGEDLAACAARMAGAFRSGGRSSRSATAAAPRTRRTSPRCSSTRAGPRGRCRRWR